MKCFTVTEKGVTAGIAWVKEPYPHVGVGDPKVEYDYRRVEVDGALAEGAAHGTLHECSIALDMKEEDRRRASYKLIPPTGKDTAQALVKLEAHCATSGRTWYELPRYTMTVAKGWFANAGPQVNTPVELIVLNKDSEVKIGKIDENGKSQLVMTVYFDGNELKVKEK